MTTGLRLLRHAIDDLKASPIRAVLSGTSLFVGVSAIVAIFTLGQVVAEVFIAAAEQANGRAITLTTSVSADSWTDTDIERASDAGTLFAEAGGQFALVSSVDGSIHNRAFGLSASQSPGRRQPLLLVAGDISGVRRLPILSGRWFNTAANVPVETVLNAAASQLYGQTGDQISVGATTDQPPIPVRIVGTIADGDPTPHVYLPMLATMTARPSALSGRSIDVLVHHRSMGIDVLERAAITIAAASGSPSPPKPSRIDGVDGLEANLHSQQNAFFGIAVIALVIAALGILNVGLASVAERARELVIRRAIGATRTAVFSQMVLSAVFVGLVATALSVAVAAGAVEWWVPNLIDASTGMEPPSFPWTAAIWGTSAALLTTLTGGAAPALVASRLDIATALRG